MLDESIIHYTDHALLFQLSEIMKKKYITLHLLSYVYLQVNKKKK